MRSFYSCSKYDVQFYKTFFFFLTIPSQNALKGKTLSPKQDNRSWAPSPQSPQRWLGAEQPPESQCKSLPSRPLCSILLIVGTMKGTQGSAPAAAKAKASFWCKIRLLGTAALLAVLPLHNVLMLRRAQCGAHPAPLQSGD